MKWRNTQRGEIATLATLVGLTVIVAGMIAGGRIVEYGSRLFSRASTGTQPACTVTVNQSTVSIPISTSDDDYASVTATVTLGATATSVDKVEFSVNSSAATLNKTADSTDPYIVHIFGASKGNATMLVHAIVNTSVSGVKASCDISVPITVAGGTTPPASVTPTGSLSISSTITPSPTTPVQQLIPSPTMGALFCTDTDGGQVYGTKGTLSSNAPGGWNPSVSYADYCDDLNATVDTGSCSGSSCRLIEYFCNTSTSPGSIAHACPGGCTQGVCQEVTTTPTPSSTPSRTVTPSPSPLPTNTPTPATSPGTPSCTITANPNVVLLNVGQSKSVSAVVVLQQPAIATDQVSFIPSTSVAVANPNIDTSSPYQTIVTGNAVGSTSLSVTVTVSDASSHTGTCQTTLSVIVTDALTGTMSPSPTGSMNLQLTPTITTVPSVTMIPSPSVLPTTTPTPTRVQSPDCTCVVGNACHHSCQFSPMVGISYASPFTCAPAFSRTASDVQKIDWCRRQDRTRGDADGKNGINLVDYDYYRRTVLLDTNIPEWVNADFNGDGEVGTIDATIVLKQTQIIP